MDNRKLLALSQALQGKTAQHVDDELHRRHLDMVERMALKLQLQTSAQTHTVRAGYGLATDRAEYQRPRSEMDRLLDRVGIDARRRYSDAELTARLDQAGVTETTQRLSVKIECQARGLTHDASEADRLLRHLGITGPVDHETIERTMDQRGYMPSLKAVILGELQARHWLKSPGNLRTMRASSPVRTGLTLRSRL